MTFKEFISFNNINLDGIMVDKIFHNIQSNMPIYMDEAMVEYFGYSGDLKIQRKSLVKLIETNFSEYQNQLWHSYKNKEYIEFCEETKENLEDQSKSSKNNDETLEISLYYICKKIIIILTCSKFNETNIIRFKKKYSN